MITFYGHSGAYILLVSIHLYALQWISCKIVNIIKIYNFDVFKQTKFITNPWHTFSCIYLFISSLHMFRASQCSSSGDRILLIHHLVWLVSVSDCLVWRFRGNPPDCHTKQSLTQTNHTRWCINTIRSPDDEHCDARNMWRDEMNKYMKKCVKLVISKNL
jgi:hypothetical protein